MPRGKNPNVGILVCDARHTEVNDGLYTQSTQDQCNYFYPDAEYLLPPNMPKPMGHSVNIRTYMDADHVDNFETRRSHIGILIYFNN